MSRRWKFVDVGVDALLLQGRRAGHAELADFGAEISHRRRLAAKNDQGGAMDGDAVS